MSEARSKGDVTLLGHPVQIFADISQQTIQKRCALKPLLTHLINRHIKYCWSFPFRLSFAYKGKTHLFANFRDGEEILLDLGLITPESSFPSPRQAREGPPSPNKAAPHPSGPTQSWEHTDEAELNSNLLTQS